MAPVVKVVQGFLQGKECLTFYGKKYYSFEGIPYAKAPVGKLRFRNPEPVEPWTGTRDATKPGNKCLQMKPYSNNPIDGSEDCLYLNVYTPSLPDEKMEKLPVIFFVHGGRLVNGYGSYYTPDYITKHDVILVTVNYRLSVLGFLCLNIPEAPGNVGLKDTVLALRWVSANISNFNGNCQNVTVFGESAGAGIVTSYLTSKMTRGLFHKVVAQSGNLLSDLYIVDDDCLAKAKNIASILGKDLDDAKSIYEFLVQQPAEDLIYAFNMADLNRSGDITTYLTPVVEMEFDGVERFFDEYPIRSIKENRFTKVPIISGNNTLEGGLFCKQSEDGSLIVEKDLLNCIPKYLAIKPGSEEARSFVRRMSDFYFKSKEMNGGREYLRMLSDVYFDRDIIYFVETLSEVLDVYVYLFDYTGNMNTRVMKNLGQEGATHGDMIQYQFYRKNKAEKSTDKDRNLVEFLSEAWTNFAKYGKPSTKNLEWLPYKKPDKFTLHIADEVTLKRNFDSDKVDFWMSLLKKRAKL